MRYRNLATRRLLSALKWLCVVISSLAIGCLLIYCALSPNTHYFRVIGGSVNEDELNLYFSGTGRIYDIYICDGIFANYIANSINENLLIEANDIIINNNVHNILWRYSEDNNKFPVVYGWPFESKLVISDIPIAYLNELIKGKMTIVVKYKDHIAYTNIWKE